MIYKIRIATLLTHPQGVIREFAKYLINRGVEAECFKDHNCFELTFQVKDLEYFRDKVNFDFNYQRLKIDIWNVDYIFKDEKLCVWLISGSIKNQKPNYSIGYVVGNFTLDQIKELFQKNII